MKKIGFWVLILFLFFATIYAIAQSSLGRNFIRNTITEALEEAGLKVEIGRIEGTLPHQIDLKKVSIQGKDVNASIDEIKLRPILWRLLKKELAFTDIQSKGISLSGGTPFDFKGKFRVNKSRAHLKGLISDWAIQARYERDSRIVQFNAKNDLVNIKGKGFFNSNFQLVTSSIQIGSDQLLKKLPFPAEGRFLANLVVNHDGEGYKGRIQWQIPNLVVEKKKVGEVKGNGAATLLGRNLKGELQMAPLAKAVFDLELRPGFLLIGMTSLDIANFQSLHIPNIYGQFHAQGKWEVADELQILHLDATATDFYYGPFFTQKASLYSDLKDFKGLIDLHVEKAKWRELELENSDLEINHHDFKFFAEGKWNHPLEIHMAGTWKDHFSANIENMYGTFFNHPFELVNPVHFEIDPERFLLQNLEIKIADATAFVSIDRKGENADASLQLDHIPLDFLSLNPLDVSVAGLLNLQADLKERDHKMQGSIKASIEQMEVASLTVGDKIQATGLFEGTFNRDLLNLTGNLSVGQRPIFKLKAALPIHLSIWPFEASVLSHKNAKGNMSLDGRIEDILDFFDLGPHRVEGQCHCDLSFSNTLYRPLVEGTFLFQDGYYENYYTGTVLQNIQADFIAEKNNIFLRKLTAQDGAAGSLRATGNVYLLQSDHYPFEIDAVFENLKFTEIDLVTSLGDGKIHIEGNALSALAQGEVEITKSDLFIPDQIATQIPNLQVTYRNQIQPDPLSKIKEYIPYPLHLDLRVNAPQSITISGRGLKSEWKGDFQIGGTLTSMATKGKLELIDGSFDFSSRSFKLNDGSLTLSGIEGEMPYINLGGTTETKGITITARLKGPLNNPQVTLQSIPPLPLGSIMSYLLFGQDISEIGGFQALQLASSLASLAGMGPDIMENTRKSLGVDRLRIITDPSGEGGETVALQVGKYISKGVLVSFTQGTEDSSPNISVEIEIKDNFIFQIESDQHQEQGKFTLKWNLNY